MKRREQLVQGLHTTRRRALAWRNVARSATYRRIRPDWVPRPHAGHLIVTFKCNLKCLGCGSWKVRDHDDLTTEQWLATFEQLRSLDVVKILGGEPMVRKDLAQLLTGVREIIDPYVLQLTTNGMMTERTLEVIHAVAWPGLQLRISVDGTEPTHDRMRGVVGSWAKVNETVQAVSKLQDRYGFKFGINFAVTDESFQDFDAMVDYAAAAGADLIPGVNVDPFLVGTVPPEIRMQQVIMLQDPAAALARLEDHRVGTKRELPVVDHLISRFLTKRTFEHQIERKQHQFVCRELRDLLYLLPNGDVVRCGMDHEPIGNVKRQAFDDIWFGESMNAYRQKVDDCPGCLQASVQILSRVYGGCLDA
ncbi:MAG: radical SAM protein [Myxococcota bacterium]|nr:radical SAM protein [Myxococcota bacterium]